jgi:hypothetical protein
MTINQGRTFCRMFFHKLLATVYIKVGKRKFDAFESTKQPSLSIVTKRRKRQGRRKLRKVGGARL